MSGNGYGNQGDWRDPEFGHGQERYYGSNLPPQQAAQQQVPVESIPGPGGGGKGKKGWLIAGVGVLALALLGGGAFWKFRGGEEPGPSALPSSAGANDSTGAAGAAPSPEIPTASAAPQSTEKSSTEPQVNDGGETDNAKFDVPPQGSFTTGDGGSGPVWLMYKDPRDQIGYGGKTGQNLSLGHAGTEYRDGYCKSSGDAQLALFVWAKARTSSPLDAATNEGEAWLKSVGTKDDGSLEKLGESKVSNLQLTNGSPAVQYRARAPLSSPQSKACGVHASDVIVTAFETGKGTATLVAIRRVGHPDALSDAELDRIIKSLRPD